MKVLQLQLEHMNIAWYQLEKDSADERHGHGDHYQVSIPLSGVTLMEHDQKLAKIGKLQRAVTAPCEMHRNLTPVDEASRILLLTFQRPFLEQVVCEKLESVQSLELAFLGEGVSSGLVKLAEQAIRESITLPMQAIEMQQLELEMAQMFLSLQVGSHSDQWHAKGTSAKHPALAKTVAFIHDELTQELSLERIVTNVGISKTHIIQLFREQIGKTPSQYITESRIKRAEELLAHTNDSVTEIGFALGFGSVSSFERSFKKVRGVTPMQYRKGLR